MHIVDRGFGAFERFKISDVALFQSQGIKIEGDDWMAVDWQRVTGVYGWKIREVAGKLQVHGKAGQRSMVVS
jgi:hypothetical protein